MQPLAHGRLCIGVLWLGVAFGGGAKAAAADTSAASFTPEANRCPERAEPVALGSVQWNGWGKDLDNTRYQPEPAIRASDVEKLAPKWSYGYQGGTEFGQPTIVDGRLFVAGSAGRVYALDAKTGCTYWTFDAPTGSRSGLVVGELGVSKRAQLPKKLKRTLAHLDVIKAPSAVFFGDDSGSVYALDAQKGTLLWKVQADNHPAARIVGAPVVYNDHLYVTVGSIEEKLAAAPNYACCTFRGSVVALELATGRVVWKSYTVLEEPQPTRKSGAGVQEFAPAGAAIYSSPTVDPKRNALYVATGASTTSLEQSLTDAVAAFNLSDGKLRWVKQLSRSGELPMSSFMASPVLRTLAAGNDVILAGQKSGVLYALDPDHGGEILWQTRAGNDATAPTAGGIGWGLAADYKNAYVAISGLLAQPANISGSLTAIDIKTGTPRWRTAGPQPACPLGETQCSHAQSQAVTVMPGAAFSGSMDGHLRAYSTINGKVLWDFDTTKAYQTLNGITASGGPLDHGGAVVVNGVVYINSGNALLAFSVDGK
jgi:polyvinyl alcohol dehydrogenase (cytochrome)